jgi:hypothetical protein
MILHKIAFAEGRLKSKWYVSLPYRMHSNDFISLEFLHEFCKRQYIDQLDEMDRLSEHDKYLIDHIEIDAVGTLLVYLYNEH